MLWLYLLGAVTFLIIALRRVLRRQRPLSDALYTNQVAVEHVHSGVAFVQADGRIGSANSSLAETAGVGRMDLAGRDWYELFPPGERGAVRAAYSQMLIRGFAELETLAARADGTLAAVKLRLVAIHDHRMRLRGHHCLVHDASRVRELEQRLLELENTGRACCA